MEERRQVLTDLGYDAIAWDAHVRSVADDAEGEFLRSLEAGFVDAEVHPDPAFQPQVLRNDRAAATNVLTSLATELCRCTRFDLAVAFVTSDGVTTLLASLLDLERRQVPGRVLVSTYLGFSDPDALRRLRNFKNLELAVFEGPLHTKGYLFTRADYCTLVVGSSNLTQQALLRNVEWNLMVRTGEKGSLWREAEGAFEQLWASDHARLVTDEWLADYEEARQRVTGAMPKPLRKVVPRITPNRMQQEALGRLAELRRRGDRRALVVSATGTGKTYLAAFDVAAADPARMLFVVHRERIARDALASFTNVIGTRHTCGLFTGSVREKDADYLFSTVLTVANHLDEFAPDAFDYVIVDEAHRSGASTYRRLIEHLRPRFLLGMTATPTRMDGFDVFALFDHNIAYQITLQRAQEEDMLAPFHYFGIADLTVEGERVEDVSDFSALTASARVDHVLSEMDRYCVERTVRGLVFCSRRDEAHTLAALFRDRGWRAVALDGASSDEVRADAFRRLEADREKTDDWLELILAVDILNEGIDIPSVNLVVMMRPTESATIFVQQLGRGLRKCAGKEYVLVLDFIGNYKKSYLIPIALSGDRTYNKDNLRRFMRERNRVIGGCSTIDFDEVTRSHIYRMLDQERFGSVQLLKQEYQALRNMLGRIPTLSDFARNGAIDPALIFQNKALGSYHAFLKKYERDYHVRLSDVQERLLRFVSTKLASGKRAQELLLLRLIVSELEVSEDTYAREVAKESRDLPVAADSVRGVLSGSFLSNTDAQTFAGACPLAPGAPGEPLTASDALVEALTDPEFCRQLLEVIDYGLDVCRERFASVLPGTSLVLYQKYTYADVCWLLGWSKNLNAQNIGGYKYDAGTNTFPVFINYEKAADISDTIRYQDRFVSPSRLVAISKSNRRLGSPDIERLRHARERGMRCFLFVRRNKDDAESKEFYFLGKMEPTGEFEEIVMEGTDKPAVEITYDLATPVPDELFDYLTSGEG